MRAFNFSAGPSTLPIEVLQQAANEMLDWRKTGMGVMEMSHRGPEYQLIHEEALADLRELLQVPAHYHILFLQGGALAENAFIPLNLLGTRRNADYIVTGVWSKKSQQEARRYCDVHIAATTEASGFTHLPAFSEWQLSADPAYLHLCTNETANGVEFFEVPDLAKDLREVPLVADMSSHLLAKPLDITKYGVIYGSAQKNIGMAGLTLVIVREDYLNRSLPSCPTPFEWKTVADNRSILNTPPTYAIYIAGLVFKWLKRQGGLAAIEARNIAKAKRLYDAIDGSDFYFNRVEPAARSRMNIPFHLVDGTRTDDFLEGAHAQGLLQLKGHESVGGIRASLYNAVPLAAVEALVRYMEAFEQCRA